jgi:SWI/SNF-related matrix-associated actin-dependent regulator 1 of chromatin subfamily A
LKIREAVPHRDVLRLEGRGEFVEGAADGVDFVVVGNANIVHHQAGLTGVKFRSVVFDESQAFKNSKAQRTKAAKAIARSVRKDGLKLCLSGTPLENRVSEFGPQLDLLDQLKQFGGLWRFYQEYAGAFKDRFGHWRLDGDVSASKLTELNQRLRETCYLRREKSQVLADLPELDHQVVYLDWDPAIRQEYVDAERDIIEYFAAEKARIAEELGESATAAKIRARMAAQSNEHLIKLGVLKKICAKNKLKMLKPVVENYHEAGHKVIVAAHHRDIVTQTATKLQAPKIIGGQKVEDTEEAKKLFQENPKVQSIVLSTQAAKTGHTLTAASQVLILEQPWTPSDYDQMVARAHRNGQTHPVTATTLIVPETIDEHIHKMLAKKRTKITAAMTGQTEKQDTAALEELFDHYL